MRRNDVAQICQQIRQTMEAASPAQAVLSALEMLQRDLLDLLAQRSDRREDTLRALQTAIDIFEKLHREGRGNPTPQQLRLLSLALDLVEELVLQRSAKLESRHR